MTQSSFLESAFKSDEEEGSPAFKLLPRDRYTAEISQATAGPTKNGKGYAVNLTWRITEGAFEGRTVFQTCLLQHDTPDAMKYGRQRFKDLLSAMGITGDVTDLDVLYNKPVKLNIIQKEDKSGVYQPKNEVTRVISMAASQPYAPPIYKADPISTGSKPPFDDKIPY
jgi:Protein of unknown function (DUF669)